MISKIKTLEDISTFTKAVIAEGVAIHPDDDFNDMINLESKEAIYKKVDADFRNKLMKQCFRLCNKNNVDIYEFMLETYLKETGLDAYVPLPSQVLDKNKN
jgi:hypothetical protein